MGACLNAVLESGSQSRAAGTEIREPSGGSLELDVLKHGRSVGNLRLSLSLPNQRCIFGRIPTCDVVLEHGSISRQHAQLATDAACHVFLSDLGSGELPCLFPAAPLPKHRPLSAAQGTWIQFSGVLFESPKNGCSHDVSYTAVVMINSVQRAANLPMLFLLPTPFPPKGSLSGSPEAHITCQQLPLLAAADTSCSSSQTPGYRYHKIIRHPPPPTSKGTGTTK